MESLHGYWGPANVPTSLKEVSVRVLPPPNWMISARTGRLCAKGPSGATSLFAFSSTYSHPTPRNNNQSWFAHRVGMAVDLERMRQSAHEDQFAKVLVLGETSSRCAHGHTLMHLLSRNRAVGKDQARPNVCKIAPSVSPAASMPRMCSTAMRMSRTIGLPPKTSGRVVMRWSSSSSVVILGFVPISVQNRTGSHPLPVGNPRNLPWGKLRARKKGVKGTWPSEL